MMNNTKNNLVRLACCLAVALLIGMTAAVVNEREVVVEKIVYVQAEPISPKDKFSEENLIKYMKELKIKHIDIVLAQARLESGNYKSPVYRENHNLFGLKLAEKRPTTSIGINRNHAVYLNWKKSVMDYALLQSSILPKARSRQAYLKYLANNYSELPSGEYEKIIKQFL